MFDEIRPSTTILLLGATGKIGFEIRTALHTQFPDVHVVCASRRDIAPLPYPNETWIQFDPFQSAWRFPKPIHIVINAIGAIQESAEMSFEKIHVGITQMLLLHRTQLGEPRIVQVSALGATETAESAFLRTKGEADALLLAEPNVTVVRPSIVCTPNTMLSQKIRQLLKIARFSFGKLLVPTGFPHTQIQPILGSEVGEAVAHAALQVQTATVVELVGPRAICLGELIHEMAVAQGQQLRLVEVSREIVESFVKHFISVWFPGLINYEQFRLLFQDNVGDVQGTVRLLGRLPTETIDFWRQEAASKLSEVHEPPVHFQSHPAHSLDSEGVHLP